jgi:hypothetical protein
MSETCPFKRLMPRKVTRHQRIHKIQAKSGLLAKISSTQYSELQLLIGEADFHLHSL